MQIQIRTKKFGLTEAIRIHIERRLTFSLDRFSRRIRTVFVWLRDLNGPKGGRADKSCQMMIELKHGTVVLEGRAPDVYTAIDHAAHRVGRSVAREIKRSFRPISIRTAIWHHEGR